MYVDWDLRHLCLVVCPTYLYLVHAGINNTRNATKIRKVLFSVQKEHLACRIEPYFTASNVFDYCC